MATTVTFERIVTEDWQLNNGFTIPANTTIGVPAHAIAMDPKLYPDPDRFDGMRFAKIRKQDPSADGRSQFVATNPASMAFGYGRHACPGRFLAANEIKAIMVHILENYDMKFKEGDVRPVNTIVETPFLPDHSRKVLFKKRRQS